MTTIEKFIQLKAFARQDALPLSLLWVVSFACVMAAPAGALGNLLALATPFLVGWRLCKFRDEALDGVITFRRAFAYCVYVFAYASMILALVQFAYFRFIDNGLFARLISDTLTQMMPIYRKSGIDTTQLKETVDVVRMLTPIQWAFMFMINNLVAGTVLGLPLAAIARRSKPRA